MRYSSIVFASVLSIGTFSFAGSVGQEVIQYSQGNPSGVVAPYTTLSGAVGLPTGDTGFGALTPFNPAFSTSHLLGIGPGGSATIRLSAPVTVEAGAKLGVFDNTGLLDEDPETVFEGWNYVAGGRGFAGSPPGTFGGGIASVSVSADNLNWFPIGVSPITFNMPTNAYTDNDINLGAGSLGTQQSDFFKPFAGTLSDFSGLRYNNPLDSNDILGLLNGSAGGTWLDLSGLSVGSVSYVRFEVPEGGRLVLDAVTAIPEPASLSLLLIAAGVLRRRR